MIDATLIGWTVSSDDEAIVTAITHRQIRYPPAGGRIPRFDPPIGRYESREALRLYYCGRDYSDADGSWEVWRAVMYVTSTLLVSGHGVTPAAALAHLLSEIRAVVIGCAWADQRVRAVSPTVEAPVRRGRGAHGGGQ